MKVGERFQEAEVIVWTELPRAEGCTIEGLTLCRNTDDLFVVWWVIRNVPGDPSYAHQGFYVADFSKAVHELGRRLARHLDR